jgi:hypothetical protein
LSIVERGTETVTQWRITMRSVAIIGSLAAVLTLAAGSAALAQSEGQKLEQVKKDNRDIRHDSRDIKHDKIDIRGDKAKLQDERAERNADLRKEERAVEHGNLKAAEKWDSRRRQEQKDVNAISKDLHKDKVDLAKDKLDRRRDLAKRDRDASKL